MTDMITVMTISTDESNDGQHPIQRYAIRSGVPRMSHRTVLLKTETESTSKTSTKQHSVTIQKTVIIVLSAWRNSNLLQCYILPYTSFSTFCVTCYHVNSQLLNTVTQTNYIGSYVVLHLALLDF